MRKRYSFLLLELIISLSIIAIMTTVLFRYYSHVTFTQIRIEQAKQLVTKRQHFHLKVNTLFSKLSSCNEDISFYSIEDKSSRQLILHFFFDNGVDPSPQFSGIVKGVIFFSDHCLKLRIYPLGKNKKKFREEVLFPRVENFSIEFFAKNSQIKKKNSDKNFISYSSWPKEKQDFPLFVLFHICMQGKNFTFAFFLPIKQSFIHS